MEEDDLIEMLQNGSELAFRQVINRYCTKIKLLVSCHVNSSEDIDEIVHDTFIGLWMNYVRKNRKIPHLKFALYRIAHNKTIDYLRKNKIRWLFSGKSVQVSNNNTPKNLILCKELEGILMNAYDKLSPKDREILMLYYVDGMKMNEIADVLSIGLESVSSRLRRARSHLRELLPDSFYQEWRVEHDSLE